jgi:glyoxylase-like metal-dependent hydrolase (beta-lactamase superfamily II)
MIPELHVLPLPTPFPIGPVNVYLAEGEPLTLIDTGPKYDPARRALETGLARRGYRVEDVERLILTHHHVDHLGLAAEIVKRSAAKVFTHAYNLSWLENVEKRFEADAGFYHRFYEENGVPPEVIAAIDLVRKNMSLFADPFPGGVNALADGEEIFFAKRVWKIFHTPGHAGGLICLWHPESSTLLCNDHLLREVSSNAIMESPTAAQQLRPKRLVEYLHHLQRMAELDPQLALPGHGEAYSNFRELVRQRTDFHHLRAQTLVKILQNRPHTLWDLTMAMFPALSNSVDWFLGLSEVQGHLDLLEQDNQIMRVPKGRIGYWQRTRELEGEINKF